MLYNYQHDIPAKKALVFVDVGGVEIEQGGRWLKKVVFVVVFLFVVAAAAVFSSTEGNEVNKS